MSYFDNPVLRGADVSEIEASGNSMEDSFLDYVTMGTVSALTSAAVGFYNTGVAFGEVIGMAEDEDYANEGDVIGDLFGGDTEAFYNRHKTGIDVAGLVAGSFIPGGAAIGALRAAQRAGKFTKGIEVATGMKKADLVLGSKQVRAAKETVLSQSNPMLNNPAVYRAYGRGLGQQLLEAGVAEFGIVATMNQNAAMNPDDLSYFEAAKQQFVEGLPFVGVAAGLGGGLEALRVRGYLKRAWQNEFKRTAHLATPNLPPAIGLSPGDEVMFYSRALDEFRNSEEFQVAKGDDFAARQKEKGIGIITKSINDAFGKLNQTSDGSAVKMLQSIVNPEDNKINFSQLDELMSGLDSTMHFNIKEWDANKSFFGKSRAPIGYFKIRGDADIDSAADYMWQQLQSIRQTSNNRLGDLNDLDEETWKGRVKEQIKKANQGNFGAAQVPVNDRLIDLKFYAEEGIIAPSGFTFLNEFENYDTELMMGVTNTLREGLGLKPITLDEYIETTTLHELSHIKSNSPEMVSSVWKKIDRAAQGVMTKTGKPNKMAILDGGFVEELLNLSRARRPARFKAGAFEEGLRDMTKEKGSVGAALKAMARQDIPESVRRKYGAFSQDWAYLLNPRELLADAGAMLASPGTREWAAKNSSRVAKFFDKHGGIAKAYSPDKLYYNSRTKETLTSFLPAINDFGRVKVTGKSATVQGLNRTFTYNKEIFRRLFDNDIAPDEYRNAIDNLDFSSQYAIAEKVDLDLFRNKKDGVVELDEFDLPMMERMLNEEDQVIRLKWNEDTIQVNSRDQLKGLLEQRKLEIRGKMATSAVRYNEHDIAQALNMDMSRAMGFNTGQMNLMGIRSMETPEVFVLNYANKLPSEYKYAAHSMQATQERKAMVDNLRQITAAEVLEDWYEKMPLAKDINEAMVSEITGTETTTGVLFASRPGFNTAFEKFSYVGKQVREWKNTRNQGVVEDFAPAYEKFNSRENGHLRAELSMALNLMSRDWYYMVEIPDGARAMIRKDKLNDPEWWGVEKVDQIPDWETDPEVFRGQVEDVISDTQDATAVRLSDEVADVLAMHQRRNATYIHKKQKLAELKGGRVTHDPRALYAPPRDLTKTKHFAFAIPSTFMEGADKRKYMVYGQTAEELESKIRNIRERYGKNYKVVTNQQAKDYKQLMKEYDTGQVFDEIEFDSSMFRSGEAAELAPNLDLQASYSLERLRNWHHRQEEYLINAGVEAMYAEPIEMLRRIDQERSQFAKSGLFRTKPKDSVWRTVERQMFDDRGTGGEFEQLWVRVNDFIGEKGSEVLGGALDNLVRSVRPGKQLTQEKFNEYNMHLEEMGYNPPFEKVMDAMLASPNMRDSQLIPSVVKTMNNLASTLLLRLDAAHSIISVMSTPILMSPVLKEAQEALRGTARRAELDKLTTVIHPGSGLKEPTVMKMASRSIKRFFTEDGKQFLNELRNHGVVPDYLQEYLDATDFSRINGRHAMKDVNHVMDKMAKFGSKFSGFKFAEEFSRFLVADSVRQIAEIRGIPRSEQWAIMSSAVDKVHGIYRNTDRAQLFQGPLGQSIGLYQTYLFNFMQNALKFAQDQNRSKLAIQAGMQGAIFGLGSYPGFTTFNQLIGETNRDNLDLYNVTNAEDPKSLGAWFMYGMGSHSLGVPMDFFSRGDLAIRNKLIVPTQIQDLPSVSIFSKAIGNMINTTQAINQGAPIGEALLHGLAHNGFNRPLQGLGTIMLNEVRSAKGSMYFDNANFVDYNGAEEINWGGMFARMLGTKPLNEAIYMDSYFRSKDYQASMNKSLQSLGNTMQLALSDGAITNEKFAGWANEYEMMGGDPQNFKKYWARQLTRSTTAEVDEFRLEAQGDTALGRLQGRLNVEYSEKPIWEY